MAEVLEFDAIVIGTGFGGSVATLRLAEQGYRVAALEQGRRVTGTEIEEAMQSPRKLFWAPRLGCSGYFTQRVFKDVAIVGGVGVGGGSLVYGAVLLEPKAAFFEEPLWKQLGIDLRSELEPHYATAQRMLGRALTPHVGRMDRYLEATAKKLGVGTSYGPVPLGIYFAGPGVTQPDPFFRGKGPERAGCTQCGRCLTGCPSNAKNTLDKNYLHLAERLGARVLPRQKVVSVRPFGDRYEVEAVDPLDAQRPARVFRAQRVFFAGGVLGTVELLLRCRDELQTLPGLSPCLGRRVRTNSEAIVGIEARRRDEDLSRGTAISSHFYANAHTHITQNRFPANYEFMKWYMGPLVEGDHPLLRALKVLLIMLFTPWRTLRTLCTRRWHKRVSVLTVMQSLDSQNLAAPRALHPHRLSARSGQ
ncbi:MAG: GMC family oxidoreductase N-terminal domain-containing protein [Myxococcales bacterium]